MHSALRANHDSVSEGYITPEEMYRDDCKQVQTYRHRWLKHLCEEYETSTR